MPQTLAVIVPCYNEEDVIVQSHKELSTHLQKTGLDYTIVFVDDGSKDKTVELIENICTQDKHAALVCLSRNFGHQIAVSAGLSHVTQDAVVIIDADLQDPPFVINEMVEKWQQGYQIVYGQRNSRKGESWFKKVTAKLFYRTMQKLTDINMPLDTGDFRLMDKCVVKVMQKMPERHRFLRGMSTWVGFKQTGVLYERAPRYAGVTKYPLKRMLALALDGIFSFSAVPLRFVTLLGLVMCLFSVLGALYGVIGYFILNDTGAWTSGWASLFVAMMLFGGLQLMSLGIIGEYIGRIYNEAKGRPLFVVARTIGLDNDKIG